MDINDYEGMGEEQLMEEAMLMEELENQNIPDAETWFARHPDMEHLRPMHRLCFEKFNAMNKKQLQEAARQAGITVGKKTKDQLCAELTQRYHIPLPTLIEQNSRIFGEWHMLFDIFLKFGRIAIKFPYLVAHLKGIPITFPRQLQPVLLVVGEVDGQPIFMEYRLWHDDMIVESILLSPALQDQVPSMFDEVPIPKEGAYLSPVMKTLQIPEDFVMLHKVRSTTLPGFSDYVPEVWFHPAFTVQDVFFCLVGFKGLEQVAECKSVMRPFERQILNPGTGSSGNLSLRDAAFKSLPILLQNMLFVQRPMDSGSASPNLLWETKNELQRLHAELTETRKRYPNLKLRVRDLNNFLAYQAYSKLMNSPKAGKVRSIIQGEQEEFMDLINKGDYSKVMKLLSVRGWSLY
jgi:hypothetical protein